jgi:hypothetical protein
VFKIAYGIALAGNPNETFTLGCSLAASYPTNTAKKWLLQTANNPTSQDAPCYSYVAQPGDYLAGIAEHFGLNILQLVDQNAQIFGTASTKKPDLATLLAGKQVLLCGITKNLYDVAKLGKSCCGHICQGLRRAWQVWSLKLIAF